MTSTQRTMVYWSPWWTLAPWAIWLLPLALFLLPANRRAEALWILLPMSCCAALAALLPTASNASIRIIHQLGQSLSMVVAALWLLAFIRSRTRLLLVCGGATVALAALGSVHGWGMDGSACVAVFVSGVALIVSFALTKWFALREYGAIRVPIALGIAILLSVTGLLTTAGAVMMSSQSGTIMWTMLLWISLMVSLSLCVVTLPFVILGLTNVFYPERLLRVFGLDKHSGRDVPVADKNGDQPRAVSAP